MVRARHGLTASLFNRLHDASGAGSRSRQRSLSASSGATVESSNVLETVFVTRTGSARVTESLNSGVAGRLPWCELARRVEGLSGHVDLEIRLEPIRAAGPARRVNHPNADIRYIGDLVTTIPPRSGTRVTVNRDAPLLDGRRTLANGRALRFLCRIEHRCWHITALSDIDARIDLSDREWRRWAGPAHL